MFNNLIAVSLTAFGGTVTPPSRRVAGSSLKPDRAWGWGKHLPFAIANPSVAW